MNQAEPLTDLVRIEKIPPAAVSAAKTSRFLRFSLGGETEGLFGMIVHPLAVGEPTTAAITAGFEKVEFLVVSGLGKLVPRAGRPSLVAREALPVDVVAVAVEGFLFVEEDAG